MASNPMVWPMAPWLNWLAPGRDMPAGGDPAQAMRLFAPAVNGDGDPALEREIVEDVATYGAQIGRLNEIVLALAEGRDVGALPAVAKLRESVAAIEKKKADYGRTALERARKALDDLRAHDRAGYDLLVATLEAKGRG